MFSFKIEQFPAKIQAEMVWKTVEKGQIIFREGDPADTLFYLEAGEIQLLQYTQNGKAVEHYHVLAGEFFAEVVIFLSYYACSALAIQTSRIVAIPKVVLIPLLMENTDLSVTLMEQMARRLHLTKILLELRSYRAARERVLRYFQIMLPLLSEPDAKAIRLNRPLKEIASNLGMSPEAFSRTLKQLQQEGIMTRSGRKITLHQP
jgi:CRP-like cAMP-binding protein